MVDPGRTQRTIWLMRFACWVTKATDTHSEYVMHIAFPVNNDFKNSSQSYVIGALSVLFSILLSPPTHRHSPLPPPEESTFHVYSESFVAFSIIALTVLLPCKNIYNNTRNNERIFIEIVIKEITESSQTISTLT